MDETKLRLHDIILYTIVFAVIGWLVYAGAIRPVIKPPKSTVQRVNVEKGGVANITILSQEITTGNKPVSWKVFAEPYADFGMRRKSDAGIRVGIRAECDINELFFWRKQPIITNSTIQK